MAGQVCDVPWQTIYPCIGGRRADDHLHGDQPASDNATVLHASFAKRHVDAIRSEISGSVAEQQFKGNVGILGVETPQQRRNNLAPEARCRGDAQMAARRPVTQFPHVFERLRNARKTRLAVLVEEFALARERRAARCTLEKARVELGFEFLHIAAHRGAANAQAVARTCEAAFIRDCEKRYNAGIAGCEAACQRVVRAA